MDQNHLPAFLPTVAYRQDARYNWLAQLKNHFLPEGALKAVNLQHYVRRGVIDLVLGTDMAKHNQHQKGLNNRLAVWKPSSYISLYDINITSQLY